MSLPAPLARRASLSWLLSAVCPHPGWVRLKEPASSHLAPPTWRRGDASVAAAPWSGLQKSASPEMSSETVSDPDLLCCVASGAGVGRTARSRGRERAGGTSLRPQAQWGAPRGSQDLAGGVLQGLAPPKSQQGPACQVPALAVLPGDVLPWPLRRPQSRLCRFCSR